MTRTRRRSTGRTRVSAVAAAVMVALEPRVLLAVPTLWTTAGPGGGGAYFGAAVDGNSLWVASDMSGIYHSANFGATWQMQNFHNNGTTGGIMGGTASQVSFTSDPNVVYIPNSNLGVAKSTDGGGTWNKLTGWTNGTAYWMAADQTTSTKILVANANDLYISTNGGTSFTLAYDTSSLFVAGAVFDGNNVYVGTNKGLLVSTNGGTSFSLSSAQIPTSPTAQYMISFTGAKEGATTRLMAITSTTNPNPTTSVSARSYAYYKLWRLDVGGTWVDKTSSVLSGTVPKFVQMARNNLSTVYLAGRDANSFTQVLKSTNGGDSFADVMLTTASTDGGGIPNKNTYTSYNGDGSYFNWGWGGWPWTFVVDNDDANRVMLANSGFIHLTSDGGATWHQADVNPADENPAGQYTNAQKFYRTAGADDTTVWNVTWTAPTNIMASYTDTTGWRSIDDGASWAYPTWNGVADNTVYKTEVGLDGKLYGAASNIHDMYYSLYLTDARINPSTQNGRVIVSSDQGATWSLIHQFGKPVVWVERHPTIANRMYAMVVDGVGSDGGVWVTNNLDQGAASTWTKLANPPRTEGHPYYLRILNDGTLVATYSGRRVGPSGSETFTTSSGVFVSTDNGATWADRSHADMVWYTKGITIDPTDPAQNTWYVAVANGWNGTGNDKGDVFRTTNRGVSWTAMGFAAPGKTSLSTNSVTINPTTKEMYVTTDDSSAGARGILYAPDVTVPGFSAANFTEVASFPFARSERVFINPYNANDVWVTTFGGGIKRGGAAPGGLAASAAGASTINLTWTDQSQNEAAFEIDRATNSTFTQNLVTTTAPINATSAAITGLSASTTYYFRIRAVNGPNKSANSSTTSATTPTATPVINGSASNDTFYLRRNGASVEVFNTPTPGGSPIYSGIFAGLTSVTFNTSGGNDTLIVDSAGGNPIPPNGVSYDGGAGANVMTVASPAAGTIRLSGGTIALSSPAMIDNLLLDAGQLDIAAGAMLLHGSGGYANVNQLVRTGRNGGAWNGNGIITSMSSAKSPSYLATLGVAPASAALDISAGQTKTWRGQTADASAILVGYVIAGDVNLDGVIDGDDFFQLDSHVGQSGSSIGYFEGDLDYNGRVDADDYFLINANYNKAQPAPSQQALQSGREILPPMVFAPARKASEFDELTDESRLD